MSSLESQQLNKLYKVCAQLHDFRLPSTRPTDFKASFKNSMNNEGSANLIEKLSVTRAEMLIAISSPVAVDQKLIAIENYLPNIMLLMNTLKAHEKLVFDKTIIFEWRGSMASIEEFFKSSDVVYEVIMVLQTKAILHNQAAKALVETDPVNLVTEAGKHLLNAASVMQYLHENLSSTSLWHRAFNSKMANPVDLHPNVCLGLAQLFKGSAQAMAVVKALGTETTPSAVKARLAVSVVNQMKQAHDTLSTSVYNAAIVYSFLLSHTAVKRELFRALVFQNLARAACDKKEVGLCIAYCQTAKVREVNHLFSTV